MLEMHRLSEFLIERTEWDVGGLFRLMRWAGFAHKDAVKALFRPHMAALMEQEEKKVGFGTERRAKGEGFWKEA